MGRIPSTLATVNEGRSGHSLHLVSTVDVLAIPPSSVALPD
jgi:hypothetical protein